MSRELRPSSTCKLITFHLSFNLNSPRLIRKKRGDPPWIWVWDLPSGTFVKRSYSPVPGWHFKFRKCQKPLLICLQIRHNCPPWVALFNTFHLAPSPWVQLLAWMDEWPGARDTIRSADPGLDDRVESLLTHLATLGSSFRSGAHFPAVVK